MGVIVRAAVKKNRVNGKDRTVLIPIYHSFGIDDIGGCVDYLVFEGKWKRNKQGFIDAKDFGFKLCRERLVVTIEDEGLEKDLRDLVQCVWNTIEDACVVERKSRY